MGRGTQRARSRDRCRVCPAEDRCHCFQGNGKCSRSKAGDIGYPNCLCRRRPGRHWHVVTLARPGGNVTGLSFQQTDLAGKRLERLREVVPALRRLAILANAGNPVTPLDMREVEAAAGTLGLTVIMVEIRRMEDLLSVSRV